MQSAELVNTEEPMARYMVERNYVQLVGSIWQPGVDTCAQEKTLSRYDVENILGYARELFDSDTITREAIAHWLSLNSGDFSGVDDFHA
jgi:hypothetical protein